MIIILNSGASFLFIIYLFIYLLFIYLSNPGNRTNKIVALFFCFVLSISFSSWTGGGGGEGI